MSSETLQEIKQEDFEILPIEQHVVAMIDRAIHLAEAKLSHVQRQAEFPLLVMSPVFADYFRYIFARELADEIAENDKKVKAIYFYEMSNNSMGDISDAYPQDQVIHMIIKVSKPSAGLRAYLDSLDRVVTAKLGERIAARYGECKSILDLAVVTEEDVRMRRGPASIITSVYTPPMKIWSSEQ
jgi:vacuolar-type H+-ATPase subunit F/Vma7